jgi:hypothetical protein
MPRGATVIARSDLRVLRLERGSMMQLTLGHPAIGVAIIGELGRRIYRMNRSLAYLTYAANSLGRDEYDPAMLAELTRQPGELANFARAFANMAAEIEAKKRRRDEMQAAAAIQNSILPRPLAREGMFAAVDLHAEMHPAREIGGDFYDYFPIDGDRLAITVADVSGKGIPAALFMAVARTVLRTGERGVDMAADMDAANRLLSADNAASMFVTAFHGVLDLPSGVLRYCNAGHNPPYVLRGQRQNEPTARETLKATGLPFGIDGDLPYRIGSGRATACSCLPTGSPRPSILKARNSASRGWKGRSVRRAARTLPASSPMCWRRQGALLPAPSNPMTSPRWPWCSRVSAAPSPAAGDFRRRSGGNRRDPSFGGSGGCRARRHRAFRAVTTDLVRGQRSGRTGARCRSPAR